MLSRRTFHLRWRTFKIGLLRAAVVFCFIYISAIVFSLDLWLRSQVTETSITYAHRVATSTAIYNVPLARENLLFQYSPRFNKALTGRQFRVDDLLMRSLGFPPLHYVDLNEEAVTHFLFATAASDGFFERSIETVATVQKWHPERTVLYYDLGLQSHQRAQLSTWCNVVYKRFNFSRYPPHVADLQTYAWKPLIIWEVLHEYGGGVMWLDSSVKVIRRNLTRTYRRLLQTRGGVLQSSTGHSTYAATHRDMFAYLPTRLDKMQQNEQWEATVFIYKTRSMVEQVLRWWVLCSLDRACIAPMMERFCSFHGRDRHRFFANCHRFDQSAINILMNNYFDFDNWFFYIEDSSIRVVRGNTNSAQLKICKTNKTFSND